MEGAVEGSHMSHPDFRAANGKIFASLTEGDFRDCPKRYRAPSP